ncbi:LysR substrate-binding domain-containing protein [Cyanobium sp. FGCU-6]|nr:LysR substrate-binding domain-containing protein [Cyanobium sp. FGCU6]
MNLDQLRVFLSVARHLHFSRAADELYITQPAVSASVAKLESQYGVKLFHRIGRRVELTDAGRWLAQEGEHLLSRADLLERGLLDFNALRRGVLNLGASLTVGNYWLPLRLKAFCERHGAIELHCNLGNAGQVLEDTARGRFDLGFLTGPRPVELEHGLDAEPVGLERLVLVVGRDHPWFERESVAATDLPGSHWILRERGSGAQQLFEDLLAAAGLDVSQLAVDLVLTSSEMVKEVVQGGGAAAAALPLSMVRQELELGVLRAVAIEGCPALNQPVWMVRHSQRHRSKLMIAFEEVIRSLADGLPDPAVAADPRRHRPSSRP